MSSSPGQRRLLVLDRDSGFVHVLAKRATAAGWDLEVRPALMPAEAVARLRVDALVVDPELAAPRRGGASAGVDRYLEAVCGAAPTLGVVVCTGRSTVAERVRAFRLGVDDWITKPCHPEEVVARLDAIARRRQRAEAPVSPAAVRAGELALRPDRFQVFAGGQSLELTRREFEVLSLLVEAEGRVLERSRIYERVWGYAMVRGDRSVDVFVRKLRSKIERASPGWRYIHTHFGVGYRFEAEPIPSPGERPGVSQPVHSGTVPVL
jgi:DNA-binding response OmpR family regulator